MCEMYSNVDLVDVLLPLSVCMIRLYSKILLLLPSLCNPTGVIDVYASFFVWPRSLKCRLLANVHLKIKDCQLCFDVSSAAIDSIL